MRLDQTENLVDQHGIICLADAQFAPVFVDEAQETLVIIGQLHAPVDAAFISSCETLLQTVITGEYAPQPSITADCQRIIRQNTHVSKSTTLNWTGRLVAMAALLIAIVCIGEFVIDREWIAGTSTPDGSTYVIRSYEIDTGFISASAIDYIADEDTVQFSTQEWSELTEYLGYEPAMIDASALGLHPQGQYDVFSGVQSRTLIMGYSNAGTGAGFQYVNCVIVDYFREEDVLFAFQQNAEGRTVTIAGQEAYLSAYTVEQPLENQNHTSITWTQGTKLFHLTGNLSEEQLIMTAEMIILQQ